MPRGRARMSRNIRAAQWKRIHATADRWPLFATAMKHWIKQHRYTKEQAHILATKRVPSAAVHTARRRLRCKTAVAAEPAPDVPEPVAAEPVAAEPCQLAQATCVLCTPAWTCNLHCLGDRGDVLEEAHGRTQALRRTGAVPSTTLEQRGRNVLKSSTTYGVPQELREALTRGYLSPNLPLPLGFRWKGRAGNWWLVSQGG